MCLLVEFLLQLCVLLDRPMEGLVLRLDLLVEGRAAVAATADGRQGGSNVLYSTGVKGRLIDSIDGNHIS